LPDDDPLSTGPTTTGAPAQTQPSISDVAQQAILRDLTTERKARKDLQTQLAEMQAAEEARVAAAAAERGEFRSLYETQGAEFSKLKEAHAALAEREAARLERLTARNAAAIEALPETHRSLVPSGLAPDLIADQIETIRGILHTQPSHPRGGQVNGGAPGGISEEARAFAVKYRTTPESAQKIIDQKKARQSAS